MTSMLEQRIGFIGAGQMATALARGLIEAGLSAADRLLASDVEEAARSLAVHGVDARLAALNGGTTLLWAATCGEEAATARLLELDAVPDAASADGVTPLLEAARRGHTAIARALLAHGADPSRQTRKGWSALMLACERGDLEMVRLLLAHRAPPDQHNFRGESALDVAVKSGHATIAAELRARGALE